MNIFVTGGTGFVGSHFLDAKEANEHNIMALRRLASQPRISLSREPQWLSVDMDKVTQDHLKGVDVLVHLASPGVSPQIATMEELYYWNVTATLRLVDLARRAGVRRIVVAGTFAEYGRSADKYEFIPPDAPLEPVYSYAASKAAASVALRAYAIEYGIELVYLRIFSAYGKGQHPSNFWPSLREAALSGRDFSMTKGEQIRDFIEIERVVEQFWYAVTGAYGLTHNPFVRNIASGHPVSLVDFAKTWWLKLGGVGELRIGAIPYRSNEVMRFVPAL